MFDQVRNRNREKQHFQGRKPIAKRRNRKQKRRPVAEG